MGAPGTLIPAEVPSCLLQNAGLDVRGFPDHTETSVISRLELDEGTETPTISRPNPDGIPEVGSTGSEEASFVGKITNKDESKVAYKNQSEKFEKDFGQLFPALSKPCEGISGTSRTPSSAQKKKVKNVSKYVISAAKDPEFAQKLHAVLLQSGASPPPDLFLDINSQDLGEGKMFEQVYLADGKNVDNDVHCHSNRFLSNHEQSHVSSFGVESSNYLNYESRERQPEEWFAEQHKKLEPNVINCNLSLSSDATGERFVLVGNEQKPNNATSVNTVPVNPPGVVATASCEKQILGSPLPSAAEFCQRQPENALFSDKRLVCTDLGKESAADSMPIINSGLHMTCNDQSDSINPMLGEVAEWEILWEDLQIGERIGIGNGHFISFIHCYYYFVIKVSHYHFSNKDNFLFSYFLNNFIHLL